MQLKYETDLIMLLACRAQLRERSLDLLRGRRTLRDRVLQHLNHLLQRRRSLAVKVRAGLTGVHIAGWMREIKGEMRRVEVAEDGGIFTDKARARNIARSVRL